MDRVAVKRTKSSYFVYSYFIIWNGIIAMEVECATEARIISRTIVNTGLLGMLALE